MKTAQIVDGASKALVKADKSVLDAVSGRRGKPAVRALSFASEIADQPQMRALCALVIAGGALGRNARLFRAGIRMLIAHELATFGKDLIKRQVDRTRPRSAQTSAQRKPRRGSDRSKELSSFPSGHSAGAIAAARAFGREFPNYGPVALAAAGAVSAVQVPRFAHYASDVAAGLAIGIAAEAAVNFA